MSDRAWRDHCDLIEVKKQRDDWKARWQGAMDNGVRLQNDLHTAREEIKQLTAEATQLSGLKIALRLREALANCVDYLPAHLPVAQAARNILKETAP